MAVSAINITIEQGADFSATYNILDPDETPPSLVSYTVIGTLKKHPGATTGNEFVTSLTTSTAVVTISLSRTVTASLNPGRYYYDLFLVAPGGSRTKVIEGNAIVNPSATLPL